ncbi:MAG: DinB family protein [Rhodospirillales bacterium]|nr:DinB family protein [Rhodospirillales bacterium]
MSNVKIDSLKDPQIMARFNRWANERLFEVIVGLDDATYRKDSGAFFGSIHATLNHLLVVDRVWTSRILGEYHGIESLDQILHDDLTTLTAARRAMDEHLILLVDRLSVGLDGGLGKEVLYRTLKGGEKHASPAHHIFLTLFNHQTHHRGQIHCLLTQAGIKDLPALDVIVFIRELAGD